MDKCGPKKEIAEYDRDGFATIHGFLRKQEISALMDSFTEVVDSVISRGDHPGAGGDTLSRYQNLRSENIAAAGKVYDTMTTSVALQSTFLSEKMLSAVAKFNGHEQHELSHFFRCMRLDPPGETPTNSVDIRTSKTQSIPIRTPEMG